MSQFRTPSSQTSTGQENESESERNRRTVQLPDMGVPIIPNPRKKLSFNTPLPGAAKDSYDELFFTPLQTSARSPRNRRASGSLGLHKSLLKKTPRTHIKSKFSPNTVSSKTEGRLRGTFKATKQFDYVKPIYWKNIQEVTLNNWVNSFLATDRTSKTTPLGKWGNSPFLNQRLRKFNDISWSDPVQTSIARLNETIIGGTIGINADISIRNDGRARDIIVDLFHNNYNPQWLICAICVFFGKHLGFHIDDNLSQEKIYEDEEESEELILHTIRNLLTNHLFEVHLDVEDDANIDREFNANILSRVLSLVLILDASKNRKFEVFGTDPPLFRPSCHFKSSENVIMAFARQFCSHTPNMLRELAHSGYRVEFEVPRVEQVYDLYTENVIQDLRDGARLSKIASVVMKKTQPLSNIQIIQNGKGTRAQLKVACERNVGLVFKSLFTHSQSFSDLSKRVNPVNIVSGDQAQSLELLWALSDTFVDIHLIDLDLLTAEVDKVMKEVRITQNLKLKKVENYWQERPFSPRNDIQLFVDNFETEKRNLLLKWACLVCYHHDISVEEYTESFRDGAVICTLIHHYCPELISRDEIMVVQKFGLISLKDEETQTRFVKKNFSNFLQATRTLGGVPILGLSPTVSTSHELNSEKDVAFGNLNYLIVGYLFRRLVSVELAEANLAPMHEVLRPMDGSIYTAAPGELGDRANALWDLEDKFNPMNRDDVQATFVPKAISPLAPAGPGAFASNGSPENFAPILNHEQTPQSIAACQVQRAIRMVKENTTTRKMAHEQYVSRNLIQRSWRSYLQMTRARTTLLRKRTLTDFFHGSGESTHKIAFESRKMLAKLEERTRIAKQRWHEMKTIERTQAIITIQRAFSRLIGMKKVDKLRPFAHPDGGITIFPHQNNINVVPNIPRSGGGRLNGVGALGNVVENLPNIANALGDRGEDRGPGGNWLAAGLKETSRWP